MDKLLWILMDGKTIYEEHRRFVLKKQNMKKTFIRKLPLLLLLSGLVFTITFAQTNAGTNNSSTDTLPKKEKKIRDLDEALIELDRGEVELRKAMREIDAEKIEREIRVSLKNLDVDMARMKEDITKAMKEVDMAKIEIDIKNALKDIDGEKLSRQIKESMAKVDMNKIKIELEKVKEIDLSKMKLELENIRPEIERSMQEAKKGIEKARQEISSYKNLVHALDKDGLLNKNADYKIEYKNKELTVNGKKLSADAIRKYGEYLDDKRNFTIQKEADNFNIHHQ